MYPRLVLARQMFQLRYFGQVGRRLKCHRLLCPRRRSPWFSGNLFLMSSSVLRESQPRSIESLQSCRPMRRAIFSYTSSADSVDFSVFCESDFSAQMVCRLWSDNHVSRMGRPAPRARTSRGIVNGFRLEDSTASKAVRSRYSPLRTAFELLIIREYDGAEAT